MSDSISREGVINTVKKVRDVCDTESLDDYLDLLTECFEVMPPASPESYKVKLKEIADALSEKFAYMNTCLNERDIILGYLGVKRRCETHCNTDCTNTKCESHPLSSAQPEQRWIPVTEKLPENREWVLGIFQEGDTGWINPIPFICDYVGKKTSITTQDNWLLKMVDEPHPYYEKLHCIAWMPRPKPYRKEGEEG